MGFRRGCKGLHGVTRDYRVLNGVTGGYEGVTRGYMRLQDVTRG